MPSDRDWAVPGKAVRFHAARPSELSSGRNVTQTVSTATHIATQTIVSYMLVTGAQWVRYMRVRKPPATSVMARTRVPSPIQNNGLRAAIRKDKASTPTAPRLTQPDQKNGSMRL